MGNAKVVHGDVVGHLGPMGPRASAPATVEEFVLYLGDKMLSQIYKFILLSSS